MIETDHLVDLLAKADCTEYELYLREVETTSFEVKDRQIECFTSSRGSGVSLRILKGGSIGFSYATQLAGDSWERILAIALSSARYAAADACNGFSYPEDIFSRPLVYDPALASVSLEEKSDMLKGIEEQARSYDRRITRVRKVAYQEQRAAERLMTSQGLCLSNEDTLVSCAVSLVAEDKGDSQAGWDFVFSRFYHALDTSSLGSAAASRAIALLGAKAIPSFRGPVILDRCVAHQFLGLLAHSFLADAVQKNRSLLRGRMNHEVFARGVNITDDGLYAGGMASRSFDGEGVPSRTTPVIEEGVLKHYLYDSYGARKDGTRSTGNSSRASVKFPPRPSCSNLYLHPGNSSPDEMRGMVSRGLLVCGVLGMHTANPITGDFSIGIEGLLIENGSLTAPVRGMALSGNIMTVYRNLACIGNDLHFYGTLGSPSILVDGMDISGN